jgi:hypothetical protein
MKNKDHSGVVRAGRLGVALCLAGLAASNAEAGSFTTDEGADVRWSLGTSLGTSWRASSADPRLISVGNGGKASSGNDNGDLNYGKGQRYSTVLNILGDIDISKDDLGVFVRGKAWDDFTLNNSGVPHGSYANGYEHGARLDDSDFDHLSKFSGVALLDAYVYDTFQLSGDHPLTLRLGNQVVNWGESLFVPGINGYGAFDLTAAHRPGAQVKEILLPLPQLFASLGVADGTSVEAFYQLRWEKTVLDGCGTYWSPSSVANCSNSGTLVGAGPFTDRQTFAGIPALGGANFQMQLTHDREPPDSGQYGIALRHRVEALDADFGLYYVRYHTRVPNVSATLVPTMVPGSIWSADPPLGVRGAQQTLDYGADGIHVVGLSGSTVIGGWSVFGEISHTSGLPVQINGSDLINGLVAGIGPQAHLAATADGAMVTGYERKSKTQAQLSTIQVLPRILGAEAATLAAEAVYQHWSGIGNPNDSTRFGRAAVFGSGPVAGVSCTALNPDPSYCENKGFATSNIWGVRAQLEVSYPDVFAGVNVKPRVFVSDDIHGYSGDGLFSEGRRVIAPGIRLDYSGKYYVDFSYSRFNHDAKYDEFHDRDFFSLVAGINF